MPIGTHPIAIPRAAVRLHPDGMEIDFSQKMRPRGPRVKIIPAAEKPPSAGTLAFPNRRELYEVLSQRDREPET